MKRPRTSSILLFFLVLGVAMAVRQLLHRQYCDTKAATLEADARSLDLKATVKEWESRLVGPQDLQRSREARELRAEMLRIQAESKRWHLKMNDWVLLWEDE